MVAISPRHLEAVDPAPVRQQVMNLVANRALEVVDKTLDEIGRGNYQAMKYLFEIAGLFPAPITEGNRAEDSLTKRLLDHLGIPDGASSTIESTLRDRGDKSKPMP